MAKDSSLQDDRDAAAVRIATDSGTMLELVDGCPEFERLASILERARAEALRILQVHGLALPPVAIAQGERELLDRSGSREA